MEEEQTFFVVMRQCVFDSTSRVFGGASVKGLPELDKIISEGWRVVGVTEGGIVALDVGDKRSSVAVSWLVELRRPAARNE